MFLDLKGSEFGVRGSELWNRPLAGADLKERIIIHRFHRFSLIFSHRD